MTSDQFKAHIAPDFSNPDINDYSGETELSAPKMMIEEIPEVYRTWIHKNVKELNLNYAHSYCQLMLISFANLNIVQGAMLFDRGDIRNKWGQFVYCTDQNGIAINPLYQAFDTIYDYRTTKIIVKAAVRPQF